MREEIQQLRLKERANEVAMQESATREEAWSLQVRPSYSRSLVCMGKMKRTTPRSRN